eukprot:scaffold129159_cov60-Phaeocystis_antarctica.AAC.1
MTNADTRTTNSKRLCFRLNPPRATAVVEPSPTPSKHARTYYFTGRGGDRVHRGGGAAGDGELVTEIELPPSQCGALSDDAAAHLL